VACQNNEFFLPAYFDGELDLVRDIEFEEHLKSCPLCAQHLSELQALRSSIRSANLYDRAPESLRSRIRAALPADSRPQPTAMSRRRTFEWFAVAAAILLAVVLGATMLPNVGGEKQNLLAEEIIGSHIRSLQPGHLYDVESTDQHTVKPWFDGKLDFAPPVVNLADQGFPLIGGRLDYVGHRNVAALVYQRQKHFINVFIWPEEDLKLTKMQDAQTIQGYNVLFWSHNGMYFWAASDLNPAELRQFAQLLQR
jgi:anti-sigma factor RsiW